MNRMFSSMVFFITTTILLASIFSMIRFMVSSILLEIPKGENFLLDIKINLITSAIIGLYVCYKEIDKGVF